MYPRAGTTFQRTSDVTEHHTDSLSADKVKLPLNVTLASDVDDWNRIVNEQLVVELAKDPRLRVSGFVPQNTQEQREHARSLNIELVDAKDFPGYPRIELFAHPPDSLQIDILMIHSYGPDLGPQAQLIKKYKKCKWAQVVHKVSKELRKFLEQPNESKHKGQMELYEKADVIIAIGPKVAEGYKRALRRSGKHKSVFESKPGVIEQLIAVRLPYDDLDRFLVLFSGSSKYFKAKGGDIAAQAIKILNTPSSYMYHLIVVLKSCEWTKIAEVSQQLLDEGFDPRQLSVRISGNHEDWRRWLSEVDMVIKPSRTEGFGKSGLLAISAGLPVLVSGNTGLGVILKEMPSGVKHVVESDDPQVWADKIKEVREKDPQTRRLEAEELRNEYVSRVRWKEQCHELVETFVQMVQQDVVPPEINLRGPSALEAYNKALTEGKACVKRVPIMLIGQDHSGKTSLKNSLMGKPFNEDEDSTLGIDVDPSHFKVSSEIWKTGGGALDDHSTNAVEAMSFEHHAARLVAEHFKVEKKSVCEVGSMESESTGVSSSSNPPQLSLSSGETLRDVTESIETSKNSEVHDKKRVPETSSDPTQRGEGRSPLALPKIPDDVASLIKKLLQEVENVQDEDEIYSVLWDFGGQSVYYATHPLFITARAMYLLVYDLSRDPHEKAEPILKQGMFKTILDNHGAKTNLSYLEFWMTSVASLTSQGEDQRVRLGQVRVDIPPVFLVCTHADEPYGGANPVALAREVFGSLHTKRYRNQLYKDLFVVNNTKSGSESECSEVVRLREKVLAVAKELPQMKEAIPIKWLKFEKALEVTVKEGQKWISLEMAKRIASEVCEIKNDQEFLTLLDFLHDQRILIHFDDTPVLNNMVVLDPQWLVDVFKKVITVKPYDHEETEFEELWRGLESTGILDEKLLEHVWGPLLHQRTTAPSLIEIMEKFSLLCPWPSSNASRGKQYLVPSMLMSHPPQDIIKLVASAQVPSLFLKFESGQVPPGLFPRLLLQFFQWGQDKFWSSENPQLYQDFARFYTSEDEDCSVILLCHSSSIEVVVHRGNLRADLTESLRSKVNISAGAHYDAFEVACARIVRRQLGLMLECMREEFCWLKNMKYEVGVMCPVCCQGGLPNYCDTHHKQGCDQEECLHFWTESDLRSSKQFVRCRKCATAQNDKVYVQLSAPWVETSDAQLTIDAMEIDWRLPNEGNDEKLLALPSRHLESLLSQPCDSKEVVLRLKRCLQLDQVSLEQPDPRTRRLIRCLAIKAKQSNRLDVFDHLREITPAGTTGPQLSECLDIRRIPFRQMRALTVRLSGGDEWKKVAEELGLNSDEIRYLDNRTLNPCEALLAYISQHCYRSVGYLYNVLNKCELPLVADIL